MHFPRLVRSCGFLVALLIGLGQLPAAIGPNVEAYAIPDATAFQPAPPSAEPAAESFSQPDPGYEAPAPASAMRVYVYVHVTAFARAWIYVYVGMEDPINRADPSGLDWVWNDQNREWTWDNKWNGVEGVGLDSPDVPDIARLYPSLIGVHNGETLDRSTLDKAFYDGLMGMMVWDKRTPRQGVWIRHSQMSPQQLVDAGVSDSTVSLLQRQLSPPAFTGDNLSERLGVDPNSLVFMQVPSVMVGPRHNRHPMEVAFYTENKQMHFVGRIPYVLVGEQDGETVGLNVGYQYFNHASQFHRHKHLFGSLVLSAHLVSDVGPILAGVGSAAFSVAGTALPRTAPRLPVKPPTETWYRAMSEAEFQALRANGGRLTVQGENFVTQDLAYVRQLQARHPALYQHIVQFEVREGAREAMIASGARNSAKILDSAGLGHLPEIRAGMSNAVHIKGEGTAINFGLRSGSVGIFNGRVIDYRILNEIAKEAAKAVGGG